MQGNFSARDFRNALGQFATGVAIATASYEGRRAGITINSFTSVSLSPPLVLFCAAKSLNSLDIFERAEGFAINVLRADQTHLSSRFAKAGEDKWSSVSASAGRFGGVHIHPSLVTFDCKLHARCDGGDHIILIGEVTSIISGARHDPLLYFGGDYRELAPLADTELAA